MGTTLFFVKDILLEQLQQSPTWTPTQKVGAHGKKTHSSKQNPNPNLCHCSPLGLVWELVKWMGMKGIGVEEFPL
jgi:hypothetical protein